MNTTIEQNAEPRQEVRNIEPRGITEKTARQTFIFREPKTPEELLALLRLRYEVYRGSRLKGFVPDNSDGLDIDPWDKYAAHYGLFVKESDDEKPIGYIRVVGQSTWHRVLLLESLAMEFDSIRTTLCVEPEEPLPMMTYAKAPVAISRIRRDLSTCRRPIVEPGRLSLISQFRTKRLSVDILKSVIAIYSSDYVGLEYAVVICAHDHRRVYEGFGFRDINDSIEWRCEKAFESFTTLAAAPTNIPSKIRERLRWAAFEFDLTGQIVCGVRDAE